MHTFNNNLQHAVSDGVVTQQEQTDLNSQMSQLLQSINQLQGGETLSPNLPSAQQLEVDRHRIMGVPVGPRLTIDPLMTTSNVPLKEGVAQFTNEGPPTVGTLDLTPPGTKEEKDRQRAAALEQAAAGQ